MWFLILFWFFPFLFLGLYFIFLLGFEGVLSAFKNVFLLLFFASLAYACLYTIDRYPIVLFFVCISFSVFILFALFTRFFKAE